MTPPAIYVVCALVVCLTQSDIGTIYILLLEEAHYGVVDRQIFFSLLDTDSS
jgi:hypothetical protein